MIVYLAPIEHPSDFPNVSELRQLWMVVLRMRKISIWLLKFCINISIKWRVLVLILLAQVITVLLLTSYERFSVQEPQLIFDPDFEIMDQYWHQDGSGIVRKNSKAISIVNANPAHHAVFQTIRIKGPGHYKIGFEVGLQDVKSMEKALGGAEVFLIYRSDFDLRNGHGKKLFSGTGTSALKRYELNVRVGKEVGGLDFLVRLNGASGVFTFSSPVVSELYELPAYKTIKAALVTFWGGGMLGALLVAIFFFSRLQTVLLCSVLCMALVGVLIPEGVMTSLSNWLNDFLPMPLITLVRGYLENIFRYPSLSSGAEIGKLGHFIIFLFLGIIVGTNASKIGIGFSLAMLAAFALLTEVLQLLVIGRTTSLNDFILDFTAAAVGLSITVAVIIFVIER